MRRLGTLLTTKTIATVNSFTLGLVPPTKARCGALGTEEQHFKFKNYHLNGQLRIVEYDKHKLEVCLACVAPSLASARNRK